MEHLKEELRNNIEKLTSSTKRILLDIESASSIDIDILLESTRKFYERTTELREVLQTKKKMLSEEFIIMPSISNEEHRDEVKTPKIEYPKERGIEEELEPSFIDSEKEIEIQEEIIAEDSVKEEVIAEEEFVTPQPVQEVIEEKLEPLSIHSEKEIEIQEEIIAEVSVKEEVITEEEFVTPQPIQEEIQENHVQIEETPIEEEVIVKEEKSRPELFDYLNTSTKKMVKQPDLFATENTSTETVGEKFQQIPTRSILDHLSSSANNDSMSSHIKQAVIEDIRQVIGINEKFLFINELFKGNMKEYNDFILTLNDIQATDEAKDYLEDIQKRKEWDSHSSAFISFLKIFERKFI